VYVEMDGAVTAEQVQAESARLQKNRAGAEGRRTKVVGRMQGKGYANAPPKVHQVGYQDSSVFESTRNSDSSRGGLFANLWL
jgi:hypothetical protein